jgi:hypothetical protein
VDSVILPVDNYTLIADENINQLPKEENTIILKDPVPLRYKSTSHIIIPFKWKSNSPSILPLTSNESNLTPVDMYGEDANKYSILGIPNAGLNGEIDVQPTISEYYLLNYRWNQSIPIDSWNNLTPEQLYTAKVTMLEYIIEWYNDAKALYNEESGGMAWEEIDSHLVNKIFETGNILYYGRTGVLCKENNQFEYFNIETNVIYGEVRIADRDVIIVDNSVDAATIIQDSVKRTDPEVEAG